MCLPGTPCQNLTAAEAIAVAKKITANPRWRWHTPSFGVGTLHDDEHGRTLGRQVRFAPIVPACVVIHELAHVVAWPDTDHGVAWMRAVRQVEALAPSRRLR